MIPTPEGIYRLTGGNCLVMDQILLKISPWPKVPAGGASQASSISEETCRLFLLLSFGFLDLSWSSLKGPLCFLATSSSLHFSDLIHVQFSMGILVFLVSHYAISEQIICGPFFSYKQKEGVRTKHTGPHSLMT